MDKVTRDGLNALALLGFVYILCTFVLPIGGVASLIVALIFHSLTWMWVGLGLIFGPYVLTLILGLFGLTTRRPRRK